MLIENILKYVLDNSTSIIKMSDTVGYDNVVARWNKLCKRSEIRLQTFNELNILETVEYVLVNDGGIREVRKKVKVGFYNYIKIAKMKSIIERLDFNDICFELAITANVHVSGIDIEISYHLAHDEFCAIFNIGDNRYYTEDCRNFYELMEKEEYDTDVTREISNKILPFFTLDRDVILNINDSIFKIKSIHILATFFVKDSDIVANCFLDNITNTGGVLDFSNVVITNETEEDGNIVSDEVDAEILEYLKKNKEIIISKYLG